MGNPIEDEVQSTTECLKNFLEERDAEIQEGDEILKGNPKHATILLEAKTGKIVLAFRESQRYWAGSVEETAQLITKLANIMKAADAYRNNTTKTLEVNMPTDFDNTIASIFEQIDVLALSKHPTFVPRQSSVKS